MACDVRSHECKECEIEELQSRVGTLQTEVDEFEGKLAEAQEKICELNIELGDAQRALPEPCVDGHHIYAMFGYTCKYCDFPKSMDLRAVV